MVAAAGLTLASVVVGAYDVLTRAAPTPLAAVIGYVLGGVLVGACWTMAGVHWMRARRAERG